MTIISLNTMTKVMSMGEELHLRDRKSVVTDGS